MRKRITVFSIGWIYAFIHFSLEVACFYFLFSRLGEHGLWWAFALLFDALAFLPQSLFGRIADKFPRVPYGAIGGGAVLVALILPLDVLALIVLGLGNALVHIDGAERTLRDSGGKLTPNAVFVSGGAFGVITGQLLGVLHRDPLVSIPLSLMAVSVALAFVLAKTEGAGMRTTTETEIEPPLKLTREIPETLLVVLVLCAVAIRAYVGYAIPIEWNKTAGQAIALFACMGVGKALGGVGADTLGYRKTTWLSLALALPFLLFGNSLMVLSLIGILLFNMTMPITVGILVSRFPRQPAFAFGITTVGLFLGTLPEFFFTLPSLTAHRIVTCALSVLALIAILICLRKERGGRKC